ncbi:unnamed protein product [Prunus armeniaca]|uniref:Uncharacterized protein n=1 Tax=Prunus armeniaca TaxID=36596 RepID=A0A6J5W3G9_PRUAR|nr:unnamed protein product [Prunus armeniaca]
MSQSTAIDVYHTTLISRPADCSWCCISSVRQRCLKMLCRRHPVQWSAALRRQGYRTMPIPTFYYNIQFPTNKCK